MSTKALSRAAFHGAVTITYFCALVAYEKLPPMPHKRSHEHYAGRWKYLTYWNLIAQFLFFGLSFIVDFMKAPSSNYHKFTKIRDKMYAGIVMPYGVFVVAVFWILYSIDRELIFPKVLDAVFPAWLNHVSHTVILPVLLFETYILRHRHPNRKDGITITAMFGLIYVVWVLYLALVKDIWPYPILQILNWGQRFIFFGAGILFITLMYIIGEKINSSCWGKRVGTGQKMSRQYILQKLEEIIQDFYEFLQEEKKNVQGASSSPCNNSHSRKTCQKQFSKDNKTPKSSIFCKKYARRKYMKEKPSYTG